MDEDLQVMGCIWLVGIVGVLIIALVIGGTFRAEVTFHPPGTEPTTSDKTFEQEFTSRHWVGGLIKGEQPDLQGWLDHHLHPGEQVTELTVVTKHTVGDMLLTLVTVGIYSPETLVVRGKLGRVEEETAESAEL